MQYTGHKLCNFFSYFYIVLTLLWFCVEYNVARAFFEVKIIKDICLLSHL